jgi:small subunit ribosomal protein S4
MARYRGPRCKLSRRAGTDLGLTGLRPAESKCKLDTLPGQHGAKHGRLSDFAAMMREKQKIRRMYGLLERQFRRFFVHAARAKGPTGENLLKLLERRLDNVVYRMGYATTRAEGRQLVSHRCVLVNGRIVNIPSYLVSAGDTIEIKEKSKTQLRIRAAIENAQHIGFPEWLDVDTKKLAGIFKYIPDGNQIQSSISANLNLVVEYYSR